MESPNYSSCMETAVLILLSTATAIISTLLISYHKETATLIPIIDLNQESSTTPSTMKLRWVL